METVWSDVALGVEERLPAELVVEEQTTADVTTLGLVELLLKEPGRLDAINREPGRQAVMIPRFLGIAASYTLFGGDAADPECRPGGGLSWSAIACATGRWSDGRVGLLLAYDFDW